TLFGTILIMAVVAGAFNFAVDPYGFHQAPRVIGFNSAKPRLADRVRLSKPYDVLRVAPQSLILGNSRAELGLDPSSPHWPADLRPVYNLSQPGSSLEMQYRLFQHAATGGNVKAVVL